jgi:Flp pilus assembly protein TadG
MMARAMRTPLARIRGGRRAVAALEFALVCPVLLFLVGATADYALSFRAKGMLASSVAAGAQYATLVGANVAPADVKIVVQQKLSLPAGNVSVTAPACYCVTGLPATMAAKACSAACSDGSVPGSYLTIAAAYTPSLAAPGLSRLLAPTLTDSATVRFK